MSLCRETLEQYSSSIFSVYVKLELECLRHLRELRADGNKIDSTDGLHNLDGLVKLSLQGNRIRHLKLHDVRWYVHFSL